MNFYDYFWLERKNPHMVLLNFKIFTQNYILDIIMVSSQSTMKLLFGKFIICTSHWKEKILMKYIKASNSGQWTMIPAKTEYWIHPAIIVNQSKVTGI